MHCDELATELLAHFLPKAESDDEKDLLKDISRVLKSYSISYQTVEDLTEEYVTSIFWKKEDLRWALEEQGIDSTEENIRQYFRGRFFRKALEEGCVEAGNEIIADAVASKLNERKKSNGIN